MIELLRKQKVLICAGTGGVGKTSISASLGVLAARAGIRTLVLTIDPAHRLAQALGIEKRSGEDVPVPGLPNLSACMIDARREFDQFVVGSLDNALARELMNNRLYQQLAGNLNGSQEFTSLVRLLAAARDPRYDLIILDTPPTQNAVDFLKAPERLYALFQDTVIGWFAQAPANESFIRRTLNRGTRIVTGALETVTGSNFIAELKDFFNHVSHLKGKIAEVSDQVSRLLHDERTGFLLVTGFDETKLREALEFQADLRAENMRLLGVVVNRWFPEWADHETGTADWERQPEFKTLKDFHERFAIFFKERQEAYDRFEKQLGKTVPVLKLPDYKNTVQGLDDLGTVATTLNDKWRSP